jgi:uncharacterized membrane protein YcaP (DUF421 family)
VAVRLTWKRGIGQATAIDFILALAIEDIIREMAKGTESVIKGMQMVAMWVGLHASTSHLEIKVPIINLLISGSERLLVKDWAIMEAPATKELISLEAARMLLRNQSSEDLSVVRRR